MHTWIQKEYKQVRCLKAAGVTSLTDCVLWWRRTSGWSGHTCRHADIVHHVDPPQLRLCVRVRDTWVQRWQEWILRWMFCAGLRPACCSLSTHKRLSFWTCLKCSLSDKKHLRADSKRLLWTSGWKNWYVGQRGHPASRHQWQLYENLISGGGSSSFGSLDVFTSCLHEKQKLVRRSQIVWVSVCHLHCTSQGMSEIVLAKANKRFLPGRLFKKTILKGWPCITLQDFGFLVIGDKLPGDSCHSCLSERLQKCL